MSCETWVPFVLRAADGREDELSAKDRRRWEAHRDGCAACREAVAEQQEVRRALTSRGDLELPPGFTERVLDAVETPSSWLDALGWQTWTYRLTPVATVLLLFVAITTGSTPTGTGVGTSTETVGLAEAWAFGDDGSSDLPDYTVLGQADVTDDALLELLLGGELDEGPEEAS